MSKNLDLEPVHPVDPESTSGDKEYVDISSDDTKFDSGSPSGSDPESEPTDSTPAPNEHGPDHDEEHSDSSDEENSVSGPKPETDSDEPDPNTSLSAAQALDGRKLVTAGPAKSTTKKRATEGDKPGPSTAKRSRKKPGPEGSHKMTKRDPNFDRVFSKADEIDIIRGMIDYTEKKRSDPLADVDDFHEFVKKSLNIEPTNAQMKSKLNKFWRKYRKNLHKEQTGRARKLEAHEQRAYDLSKIVWGEDLQKARTRPLKRPQTANKPESAEKAQDNGKRAINPDAHMAGETGTVGKTPAGQMASCHDDVSMDGYLMRAGATTSEGANRAEGADELRRLRMMEMELHVKLLEVKHAIAKLVVDSMKKNDN